jgi:oxygen-independent coproporphyrinogen-3 oxidase
VEAGIYVHIPYCASRCTYCDFNTYTLNQIARSQWPEFYLQHLVREIRFYLRPIPSLRISSVFFGGGTPTLLKPDQLGQILATLEESLGESVAPGGTAPSKAIEITVEANPDSITAAYIQRLADLGVNRLSIGMQSAHPSILGALGRTHSVEQVAAAVQGAKAAGLQVSLDLIYGCPQSAPSGSGGSALGSETLPDWQDSLATAIAFEPDHISCYALTLEPNVPLYRHFRPDPDQQAEMYQLANQTLTAAGFHNYEISNWAKPGCESQHNINYWNQGNWWGFGAGAHSAVGRERWHNHRSIAAYFQTVQQLPAAGSKPNLEVLNDREFRNEQIMLGIRTRRGIIISAEELTQLANFSDLITVRPAESAPPELKAVPSTNQPQYWLTLNPRGRFLADTITRALITS